MGYVMFDDKGMVRFRKEPNIKKKRSKKKYKRIQKMKKKSKQNNRK